MSNRPLPLIGQRGARLRELLGWLALGLPLTPQPPTQTVGQPTRTAPWGAFFARHPRLLHVLVATAMAWSAGYLAWRLGWSMQGANPVLWAALLATELYGLWNLAMLAWMTWELRAPQRPGTSPGRAVDVYVCTYDEPLALLEGTLAGCALLTYPHTTYVLDDGRREEVRQLAEQWGARYLTRAENRYAKAGNINNALPQTDGELVLVLDADHVPFPDALDTLVGYFDDPRLALVQVPHDFSNHDSVQHYDLGRHEQSVFYSVICPGKNRHNAAFWCGSGALIRRSALLEVGGVATETIAEDFHTTIKLHRAGWRTAYDPRIVLQGKAPHNLAAYLLQRDRWARGNLAVFTTPESPLRARGLSFRQRLSYFASLSSYLAGPMRLVILLVLAAVLWTGALPLHIAPLALGLLWAPATLLTLMAGSGLCRGQQSGRETVHYELCTAEIFTRALRCVVRPGRTTFRVTPKEGVDLGGWETLRQFPLLIACGLLLGAGVLLRIAQDAGLHIGILGGLHGFAAWFVPVLGVLELRRVLRTLTLLTRRRQLRVAYRTPLRSTAVLQREGESAGDPQRMLGKTCDVTPTGIALELPSAVPPDTRGEVTVWLPTVQDSAVEAKLQVTVRSCHAHGQRWRVGAEISSCDADTRRRLLEYCHIVWPYQRLHGPGSAGADALVQTAPSAVPEPRLAPALQMQS